MDVVLLDVNLPGLDGLETMNRLQDIGGTSTPVIGLSGHTSQIQRKRCLQAGMSAYLTKPFEIYELSATIQRLLEKD